ncbi:MAG: acyltransferase [Lachnospiraceae bacterium]|jgi:surface polysaccharide O-acyltransferase-like enzyme|nr:acyltransferase [Lachnospiraceae bacterium]
MKEKGTVYPVQALGERKRMANLELLRCVAMMMVVVLHYLGKGGLLADLTGESLNAPELAAWLLEAFCIVAVNVYMFLSGYFLSGSSFRLSRLIQLWMQVWLYSVALGLAGALSGVMRDAEFDLHYLLALIFPILMGHYWFMTAYVFLYLMLPLAGMAVERMTKRQLQVTLGLLLLAFCVIKSVLPLRLDMAGQGYDCLWYLCVFLTAAYVRKFGISVLDRKWTGAILYVGGCLGVFAGTLALRQVYLRTGSLERMLTMFLEYNHVLPFLAAVGLFGIFRKVQVKGKAAAAINRIAPYTLGVYLLHENFGLRYSWQDWLGADRAALAMAEGGWSGVVSLLFWTLAAVAAVFLCGILADMARRWIFHLLHRGLSCLSPYRRLVERIEGVDAEFRRREKDA